MEDLSLNALATTSDTCTNTFIDNVDVVRRSFAASCNVVHVSDRSFTASCAMPTVSTATGEAAQPEMRLCYWDGNSLPNIHENCRSHRSSTDVSSFTVSNLTPSTTYHCCMCARTADSVFFGDVFQVRTLNAPAPQTGVTYNGHRFVDLGLPSGLLWAETNIGAASPADDGAHFAWGETKTKAEYSWSNYKFNDGETQHRSSRYNDADGAYSLSADDDAATVMWGRPCRIPSEDDYAELLDPDNCTWVWKTRATSYGDRINGYEVTSLRNGNSIFLPASGGRYGESLCDRNSYGDYWTSSRSLGGGDYVSRLSFDDCGCVNCGSSRHNGFPIRPVACP